MSFAAVTTDEENRKRFEFQASPSRSSNPSTESICFAVPDLVVGTMATAYCVSRVHRSVALFDLAVHSARLGTLDKGVCFVFRAHEP
jgi:hypothetical protein